MSLSPEVLNAFVDGELEAEQQARVEQALREDAEARRTVARLRRGVELLRATYDQPPGEPLPAQVLKLFESDAQADGMAALRSRGVGPERQIRDRRWIPVAVAAALVALLVTAPASYFLAAYHVERQLAVQAELIRADYQLAREARARALEKLVSGQTVSWDNPDSGSRGEVTPVRTFKTTQGQWCREYVQHSELISESASRKAVACRDPDGSWRDRLEILTDS